MAAAWISLANRFPVFPQYQPGCAALGNFPRRWHPTGGKGVALELLEQRQSLIDQTAFLFDAGIRKEGGFVLADALDQIWR